MKCHAEVPVPITLQLPTGKTVPDDKKVKYYVLEKK
jgi:hypothetical protein